MVVCEAKRLAKKHALSYSKRKILITSAWLHDIGKVFTTAKAPDGSIRAPSHAKLGAHIAKTLLSAHNYTPKTIRQITLLVHYHGHPWKELDKKEIRTIAKAGTDLFLLYLIALADYQGRRGTLYPSIEKNLKNFQKITRNDTI